MSGAPLPTLLFTALTLCSGQAGAYVLVPYRDTGEPTRWRDTLTISVVANIHGSLQIDDDSEFTALQSAAENWNSAIAACSPLRFVIEPPDTSAQLANDGRVAVVWVQEGWFSAPEHNASTGVQYGAGGQILDADVLLNEQHHQFTTLGEEKKIDLESTLTHELGHVLGLDHTCYIGQSAPEPLPLDHLGQPIPPCSSTNTAPALRPTMYPAGATERTERRSPDADDVAGVCALYPPQEEAGGCAVASQQAPPPSIAGLLGSWTLLLLLLLRGLRRGRSKC